MNEEKNTPKNTENNNSDSVFSRVYHTYRAEFRKIVWPSRATLIKHTFTVVVVSLIFGAYIALLDGGFGILFGQFVQLVS